MNLFERIKNIRKNNLQEKMKFPGGTGDIGFTAPKRGEKVQKRLTRADKLGTPDPFDADYDKKVKKVDGRTKTGKVFKSTKPVTTSAPGFGKGDTPGEIRVKGLEVKKFTKTRPKDIKLPQSFKAFKRKLRAYRSDLQDFKDKDIATMRTGKSSSKVKVSGANNLSRQDVGMAPPDDTPKKTKPQKGVSATEITKKYNQKRAAKASKNTMPSGKDFINKYKKQAETATTNLRKKVDTIAKNPKLTGSEKALKSRSVMKDVKTAQNFARGYANPKTVQTAITVPKDIKTVQSAVKGAITKKGRTITKKFGVGATKYATKSGANIAFGKSPAGKIVKKIGLKPTYGTRKIATTLVKKGGLPAVVGLGLLSSPYARTAIKGALLGGGLSAFKNPKPKLAKLSSKKIVGSSVKLGQKIPTTLPKPK